MDIQRLQYNESGHALPRYRSRLQPDLQHSLVGIESHTRLHQIIEEIQCIGCEGRTDWSPVSKELREHGYDQNKVFCYSKVVNAITLAKIVKGELGFKPEPWLNCIAYGDIVVAYVWDTREVVSATKNHIAADAIRSCPWEQCALDAYNAFDNKPMLLNSSNHPEAVKVVQIAKNWLQPWIHLAYYKSTPIQNGKAQRFEFDITTVIRNGGEILIGEYYAQQTGANWEVYLDLDIALVKDAWPLISPASKKFLQFKQKGLLTYADIRTALMTALTTR